jgi:flagellar hook-associated protein 3 FlgL
MVINVTSSTQQYLNSLNLIQRQMTQAQTEASSGLKVQQASDAPSSIATIYSTQTDIALNTQEQTNLNSAQTELSTADSSLQSAIAAVQSALSIAAQAASTTTDAQNRVDLATEIAGLQQQLVSISQTKINGRFIFSGDNDTQAQYTLNPSAPEGVTQNFVGTATRTIADANGTPIAITQTAQQIFDPSSGTGSTFKAMNDLYTALQANDTPGIAAATSELNDADTYLNTQLEFYGNAQNQVSSALALSQQFQVQQKTALGNVQNADLPAVALQLTQTQTEQQASLSVAAKIEQMQTVFSYLG